ncbi:MAG: hypothetical protein HOP29_06785 [Phycisphaerales bacterium]|nr:hypothetical protein [Phycisphaerales bacterium]
MSERRPGTVLVLVVAVLSMLFVIGTAFLTTVTFENATIDRAKREMRKSSIIDKLSAEVGMELKRGFVGNDGKAWNQDTWQEYPPASGTMIRSRISVDQNGEVAGVNPLIASIEPYEFDPGEYAFYASSDLEATLDNRPTNKLIVERNATGVFVSESPGANLLDLNRPLDDVDHLEEAILGPLFDPSAVPGDPWNQTDEGGSVLDRSSAATAYKLYRRDADGDGVWDSYQYELPASRYSSAVRGDLAEQLRDPKFTPNAGEEDRLQKIYYAVRVIPHGAMVNAGAAHKTLLETVFDPDDEVPNVIGPYVQEGEEPFLRRRFLLPSRDPVLSQLQNAASGQAKDTLYDAFKVNGSTEPLDNRWWPIDTGDNGDDISGIDSNSVVDWLDWVEPLKDPNEYDYRHLVTTVSHDDQMMRSGREPNKAMDWIDEILKHEDTPGGMGNDDYAIDDWPTEVTGISDGIPPLNARLKVSLPGLLEKAEADLGMVKGTLTLEALLAMAPSVERDQFIGTIQDGFMLMLRNVDSNGDGALWKFPPAAPDLVEEKFIAETAAALTANLIDYADTNDEPTGVLARKPDGQPYPIGGVGGGPQLELFGIERQPFITEVYAHRDTGSGVENFAVELFNPSKTAIPLGSYTITVVGSVGPPRDFALTVGSPVVGAEGFATLMRNNNVPPAAGDSIVDAGFDIQNLGAGNRDERVILRRDLGGVDIVVDVFDISTDADFGKDLPGAHSLQRHVGGPEWKWRAPVPVVVTPAAHTLGSHTAPSAGVPARPVWVEPVDMGSFELAFPTTGSLLLLCRHANMEYDDTVLGDPEQNKPFTADLVAEADQIDNGRMPVFDSNVNQRAQVSAQFNGDPLALDIPWGQLVFDYFTALPRKNPARMPNDMKPLIDMDGLRVHGRVDLNSAPWTVLRGAPFVPMNNIPEPYRGTIREAVYPGSPAPPIALDTEPQPINDALAQSIVAYREGRQIDDDRPGINEVTEDFAVTGAGRHRAGTGFLTVGELANVRAFTPGTPTASGPAFNFDGNNINGIADEEDFVKAAAVLIALGDWVTTRSHVFTVYGTLRGAGTKSAVDQRAVRFQETVDRLPVVTGQRLPTRVGPRIVGPYTQAAGN